MRDTERTIYGYWVLDEDGNPELPEVSVEDPKTNSHVAERHKLFYTGHNLDECHDALKAVVVLDGDRLRWVEG